MEPKFPAVDSEFDGSEDMMIMGFMDDPAIMEDDNARIVAKCLLELPSRYELSQIE